MLNITKRGIVAMHCTVPGRYRSPSPDGKCSQDGGCGEWHSVHRPTSWQRFQGADIRNNMFASVISSGGTNFGEEIGHLRRSEEELGLEAVFQMDEEWSFDSFDSAQWMLSALLFRDFLQNAFDSVQ